MTDPSPVERLALSRERLRGALLGESAAGRALSRRHAGAPRSSRWWDEIRALPGAGILIEATYHWWAKHPLRATALVGFNAVRSVARPLAERHPLGLVLGALVVGGLLAWRRPWRWVLRPALTGLLPQLLLTALAAQARRAHNPAQPALPAR